jgi:minor extracellular serine protease Vpr
MSRYSGWKLGGAASCVTILAAATAPASLAADRSAISASALPASIEALRLPETASASGGDLLRFDPELATATGRVQVMVHLRSPAVAKQRGRSASEQIMAKETLKVEQQAFKGKLRQLARDAKVVADVQMVANALFIDADAEDVRKLANDPNVTRVSRVVDYQLDLSETVPYIGATAVQNAGFDGEDVRVAVLDSGIDYTHIAFGGPGTAAAYEAAWGVGIGDPRQTSRDGLFPTSKVVEGYDFVGELWPTFGPLAPDDDPIDFEGHGTHVADIIGGAGGVAPGVDLYAVKVCSAVSSSCSGIALIQGMEYVVDPNGDGDTSDRMDVVNMSLGSNYGQAFDDDLAFAVDNATAFGVMTVASAGNGSDKPYITGTPAAASTALSVAQTQVPSAALGLLSLNGADYPAEFQPWSTPPAGVISGPLQYGNGAGGNLNGCAPFPAGSLAGLVVLVDRGACNFTRKIKNIGDAGGVVGIIGLVAPGAPFAGGDGGDRPITIPGYMISQADSNAFKAQVGGTVTVDPANILPLAMQMVGSSSRGPRNPDNMIKPEIGAPGASVSAIAGSGTGTGPFGGTSGAAPMVSGSAALLLDAYPGLSPAETKARLMNNGYAGVETDPFSGPAPISRIGGGEVRVDRALKAPAAAWDEDTLQGGLSFGFVDVSKDVVTLHKKVRIRNYSNKAVTYSVQPTFRDPAKAGGPVAVSGPSKVTVQPGKDAVLPVKLTISGADLPTNAMSSGAEGANPASLTFNEFDGYLFLDDGKHPIHLPWHVLPRKAAELKGRQVLNFKKGQDLVSLENIGVGTAQTAAYSLLAVSPNQPEGVQGGQSPTPDARAFGVATFPVPAQVCSANQSFVWQFAVNTWERQSHLLPVSHIVYLDTNQDGVDDYAILNRDLSGLGTISDGRQVAWALNLAANTASAFFFAEHATNTGNTVLTVCAEQVGLSAADLGATPVDVTLVTQDFYFGGPGDLIAGLTVTPFGERYVAVPDDIAGKSGGSMAVYDFGALEGNTEELGIMLITNSDRGSGNRGGAVQENEAMLFMAK